MQDEDLDKLLNQGLSGYSRAEPSHGFEHRIMIRIQSADKPRLWPWVLAIPALACCLFFALVLRPRPETAPDRPVTAQLQQKAPAPQSSMQFSRTQARRPHSVSRRPALPVPSSAPAPLTAPERALLDFIARVPAGTLQEVSRDVRSGVEPLEIEVIQIQPLRSSD
jgi:hypothetical protein